MTGALSNVIGAALVTGEDAVTVQSAGLAMSVAKEDPCSPDAATSNHSTPALSNGVSGSFSHPPGAGCGDGASEASDPSSVGYKEGVQASLTLFKDNVFGQRAKNSTGTPLSDISLSEGGKKKSIKNLTTPIIVLWRGIECARSPPHFQAHIPPLPAPEAQPRSNHGHDSPNHTTASPCQHKSMPLSLLPAR